MPNNINEMKKFVKNVKKLVEKKVNDAKTDTSKKAIVQSLNGDGTANIIINGEVYNNVKIRAGLQPQINEVVLVSIPNNNTKDIFIDLASSTSTPGEETNHTHSNLSILETITQALINAWNSAVSHISDTIKHITSDERNLWNTVSNKVDKIEGKGLSTEDYTTAEKQKLAGIEEGANKYIHPSTHPASMIVESTDRRFVSDAERANWNAKETPAGAQEKANIAETNAKSYTDEHDQNTTKHITATERTNWNDANAKKHTHSNKSILDTITQTLINSVAGHISNAVKHITSNERDLWNTVSNKIDNTEVVTTATPNKILKLDSNSKLPASITGNADGNASTATKLQTARTINLSGDVIGSANFDGSSNITINATVVDDSHNHIISNVDGLQVALDGKSDITHNHNLANLAERNYTSLVGRPADDDFHTLTALLDSANDDELVIYDTSDGTYKKITRENLFIGFLNNDHYVFIKRKEEFVATEGQTVFNLTQGSYKIGTGRIDVYIWGNKQPPTAYVESSPTSITLVNGVEAGTKVLIEYIQIANVIDYVHASTHAINGEDPITPAMIGAETPENAQQKANQAEANAKAYTDNKTTTYIHYQTLPSNNWIINHNLTKYPSVTIVDSSGNVVVGEVKYIDNDTINISFAGAFAGTAYLN